MSDMRFCPECNNLLQSKEDKVAKQLMFLCPKCEQVAYADVNDAVHNCVDRTNYNYKSREEVFVHGDLASDPTLGRTKAWTCGACGGKEAVFFQLPERVSQSAMSLVFVCCERSCGSWARQDKDDFCPDKRELPALKEREEQQEAGKEGGKREGEKGGEEQAGEQQEEGEQEDEDEDEDEDDDLFGES